MLSRFIVSFSFSFMVIWISELFPTTVRSAGMGIVFGLGLSGGAISPYVV
jgi:hypothetical protein